MPLHVPERLVASCRKTPERWAWLGRLPAALHNLEHRWSLTRERKRDAFFGLPERETLKMSVPFQTRRRRTDRVCRAGLVKEGVPVENCRACQQAGVAHQLQSLVA